MSSKNNLRIIGGMWRSRRIQFIDSPKIRPTPDRVRETLFNWLINDISGAVCLDLFSGSGALGFEALSRGAEQVILVEEDVHIASTLSEQKKQFKAHAIEIKNQSALDYLQKVSQQFDVIFLDPPFDSDLLDKVVPFIINQQLLSENGTLYVESSALQNGDKSQNAKTVIPVARWSELVLQSLSCVREKVSGEVRYALYKRGN
ncbi:MAG: 16S rRNA (guanine(966)-N(2))-methyltransferase RsmD [Gammaproteobacteria bacterium]